MSDEQKKDETAEETSVQDEGVAATGPAEESEGPAGGDGVSVLGPSDSSPPVEETSAADAGEPSTADEGSSDDAPAAEEAEAPAAEEALAEAPAPAAQAAEPDPEDDLPWKERSRLQRSRRPHQAGPTLTPEDRAA